MNFLRNKNCLFLLKTHLPDLKNGDVRYGQTAIYLFTYTTVGVEKAASPFRGEIHLRFASNSFFFLLNQLRNIKDEAQTALFKDPVRTAQ